ncbi:MAG: TdeIII family type II restriction endonuclease [Ignavibacteriales bacterium]|nr:TdeIII family type II restriction endonuclease [Ignavibacteriales bacterium]
MSFTENQIKIINDAIKNSLKNKFKNYKPETNNMPFHYRLLGKDRMALYSFMQSLVSKFGNSIFEPVAVALGKLNFIEAKSQQVSGNKISEEAQKVIQQIMDSLITGQLDSNKIHEIDQIRNVCKSGALITVKPTKVDLQLRSLDGTLILIDIKTVKPNRGNFKEYKRTLLEWVAAVLSNNPEEKIKTAIAIPYNPYEPKPYERWTAKGMLDLKEEIYVANEFWDFLGGVGAYHALLDCFEKVGIELRPEIDKYFERFRNE